MPSRIIVWIEQSPRQFFQSASYPQLRADAPGHVSKLHRAWTSSKLHKCSTVLESRFPFYNAAQTDWIADFLGLLKQSLQKNMGSSTKPMARYAGWALCARRTARKNHLAPTGGLHFGPDSLLLCLLAIHFVQPSLYVLGCFPRAGLANQGFVARDLANQLHDH